MASVFDVKTDKLINIIAKTLKEEKLVEPPKWSVFVKTGSHKSRKPSDIDFWYKRCASLLRRTYVDGPIGVNKLRKLYGGRITGRVSPERKRRAGGSIIRKALQQLEKAGLIKKSPKGKIITKKGMSFLDNAVKSIL